MRKDRILTIIILKEKDKRQKKRKMETVEANARRGELETLKPVVDDKYSQWKTLVPILYDSLADHNLVWPSLSCRWGPKLESKNLQCLYFSEQTNGSVPNTLVIANCEGVNRQRNEEACSLFVKKYTTIIHPGEVNRIRVLPQNGKIVATHTDSPHVLIWDTETQSDRLAVPGAPNSRPDLILTGHQDTAEYALAMCHTQPLVLSGGKDKSVVLWSMQDHITTASSSFSIGPRGVYHGHENTVEDVAFCPSNSQVFCSVGDDSCLILWDARTGTDPAMKVEKAHEADIHCVDWNPHGDNLILTGSADSTVRVFDRRNMTSNGVSSPIYQFEGHRAAVLCVQWSPDKSSVFGSSAEDGLLNLWDYDTVGKKSEHARKTPAGLFFQHAGHRGKVVDFHWNVLEPWTIASVSDNSVSTGRGGTLQVWRMNHMMYRPTDEVVTELKKFKSHIKLCASKP